MADTPIVAFNNIIKKATLTKGRFLSDINSIFNNDLADSFVARADLNGVVEVGIKTLATTSASTIFGQHRYDLSGQTIDFNYNVEAHNGISFQSVASGSFINQKESLFTKNLTHTLGVPSTASVAHSGVDIFRKVVWTGNNFLAISATKLFSSTDGLTWVQDATVPAGTFNDIKGVENFTLIVGDAGYFAYFDGSSWTVKTVTTANLHCVTTNQVNFILGGSNNEIWTTIDLINFTQETSPVTLSTTIWKWVEAIGFAYNITSSNESYSSFDNGATYAPLFVAGTSQSVQDVKVFESVLYIAGTPGMLLKSDDFITTNAIGYGVGTIEGLAITNTEILAVDSTGSIKISEDSGTTWQNYAVSFSVNATNVATNGIDFIVTNIVNTETLFVKNRYRITYSNLSPSTDFVIPELFLGDYLEVGHVNYGVDPKSLRNGIKAFNSENGRIFETILWKRLELSFSLSVIDTIRSSNIDTLRQYIYETRNPIWFMFSQDTDPYATYLMKVKGNIDLKIHSPVHKSTSIKFIEFI